MSIPNIKVYIPACCESLCKEKRFLECIFSSFDLIKTTEVGRTLLEHISKKQTSNTIFITTHRIFVAHHQWVEKKHQVFSAKADDPDGARDPNKGSGTTICIHPEIEDYLPRIYSHHHYKQCVKRKMVSEACGDIGSPCNRKSTLIEILFHELVHAKNNLYGSNKNHIKLANPIYTNQEEYNTILLENTFQRQLEIKIRRWGHQGPDNVFQQKILSLMALTDPYPGLHKSPLGYQAYSRRQVMQEHFLRYKVPQMIASFNVALDRLCSPTRITPVDFFESSDYLYES